MDSAAMIEPALVLAVTVRGMQPMRIPLAKRVTSIGSDATADIRLATVTPHWAVVHRGDNAIDVVVDGARRRITPGASLQIDDITLALESAATTRDREHAIEALVSALAAVDSSERAVELLLTGLIGASGADLGALILTDGEAYSVAAARDRQGNVLEAAGELLSDTIVRDVLGTGERIQLDDVAAHSRYAAVPSVNALKLGSALCLPMRLDGKTLGAVFLARHDRAGLDERTLAELRVLAAVAVPFLAQLRAPRPDSRERDQLLGESPTVQQLRTLVRRVGPSDLSALLHGPSGSGKELVARAIHAASPRAAKPMIAINCASVAPTLLDAELFGYRKGSFTGAVGDRVGLIEAAHGSTLFLDEIGDMPLTMQAAMLRVLEQREVKRLGDNVPRAVDFRLISATHKDLDAEVAAGRFRADLLFRLREVTLEIPSLAERGDDVQLLAHTFLRQAEVQLGLVMHTLTDDAIAALRAHRWPGNVRELKAAMRRVAILADSKLIRAADLGLGARAPSTTSVATAPASGAAGSIRELIDAAIAPGAPVQALATLRDELVRRYVLLAIERCGDDRDAAAKSLDIGVRTLYRYIS
jgi:DNA-binding NtrC family response regulator